MRTLFEISDDLNFLEDFLTDAGGDITDEAMEAEVDKWLADLGAERDTKIDNYCALYKELFARGEARKVEAARIASLGTLDTNAAERLRSRLMAYFTVQGIDKVETLRFRVSRVNNGGALPLILEKDMLDDPATFPEEYRKTHYEADRQKIADDLAAGVELEFARFGERGKHLRIK